MAAVGRQKEVTTREVASITFGMYTDDEVRKLSVKRVTSPLTYDSYNNIIPGGLYDTALGPINYSDRCATCGLGHAMCPGHFGHIELPLVVYNPLVFGMLYRLLKHTCLNCHQFKMARQELTKFLVKFSALSSGDLVAASLIHTAGAPPKGAALAQVFGGEGASPMPKKQQKGKQQQKQQPAGAGDGQGGEQQAAAGKGTQRGSGKKQEKQQQQRKGSALLEEAEAEEGSEEDEEEAGGSDDGLLMDGDLGTGLGAYDAAYGDGDGAARVQRLPKTLHIQDAMRTLVGQFWGRMPGAKCQNCGAQNPSIRKQGASKLFKQYSRRAVLQNFARGIDVTALLGRGGADADDGEGGQQHGQKRKRGGERGSSEESDEAAEQAAKKAQLESYEAKETKGAAIKKAEQEQEDWLLSDEQDEEDEGEAAAAAAGAQSKAAAAGGGKKGSTAKGRAAAAEEAAVSGLSAQGINVDEATKPKYMTPEEVEGHLRQLCRHESGVLCHIFGAGAGFAADEPDAKAGAAGPAPHGFWAAGGPAKQHAQAGVAAAAAAAPGRLFSAFFLRALAVPPNRFRPPSVMGESKYEHAQNITLSRILQACIALGSIESDMAAAEATQAGQGQSVGLTPAQVAEIAAARKLQAQQRFVSGWLKLQNEVNALIDSTTAENSDQPGVRQQLEKKEGLFRKNMMGKRVNYAARSVISPDPYIGAGEIGVPPYFATRLSFPEATTPHNFDRLRQLVINGPSTHPGALAVEDCRGQVISLGKLDQKKREAVAKSLLLPSFAVGAGHNAAGRGKIVHRHLLDGDIMLTNRQPTLHKPGLMAHRARVLAGERTIRMHYANCATFNADFDGDEINLHLPQDHLGRAEGYQIVHADRQFIVPTDGKPIRGLIQDHVVAGVTITCRDAFFTRAEFSQLLFIACTPWTPGRIQPAVHLDLPPPVLLKPRQLWTGKQLLSAVVGHFSRGRPPLSFSSGSKVPLDYWGRGSDEGEFLMRHGQLLTGCLDKAQFGKFGLVHAMQELYGDSVGGQMLNALSRLLTARLQSTGFTCGLDDLLLTNAAEAARSQVLGKAEATALAGSAEVVRSNLVTAKAIASGQVPVSLAQRPRGFVSGLLAAERAALAAQLAGHYALAGPATGALLDAKVTGVMHPLSSEVIRACIPAGQAKPFPANCMALMTVSGAKGSTVNFSQIACLLGQQELEGRRVPRTAHGKTLPCFRAYDGGARAGGFVGDRFLTGLRPQEYYFHCMAGREGLVDTTVKTSRSGYLQRCLVKNLESLRVTHDGSVRDVCDGSLVQLSYGDDGLDVTKTAYIKQPAFLAANAASLAQRLGLRLPPPAAAAAAAQDAAAGGGGGGAAGKGADSAGDKKHKHKHRKQQQQQQEQEQAPGEAAGLLAVQLAEMHLLGGQQATVTAALRRRAKLLAAADAGDAGAETKLQQEVPIAARWFASVLGVTSESFGDALERFCGNPQQTQLVTARTAGAAGEVASLRQALAVAAGGGGDAAAAGEGSSKKKKKKQAQQQEQLLQELVAMSVLAADSRLAAALPQDFRWLMQLKFMAALAAPGEAVGVLAAQSVGEPSTQMTLNTFHMAGRGEANVTLGIPRLREILMTAAARIKTPTMTVPLRGGADDDAMQLLVSRLRRLKLAEALRGIKVWERPAIAAPHLPNGEAWGKGADIELRFWQLEQYPAEAEITWAKLEAAVLRGFIPGLMATLKKHSRRHGGGGRGGGRSTSSSGIETVTAPAAGRDEAGGARRADDDDGGDGEGGEGAASNRASAKGARGARGAAAEDDEDAPDEAAEDEEADEELREGKLRFRGGRGEAATYDGPDEEDAEIEAAVDAEMRHRLGESSSSEDEATDDGGAAAGGRSSSKRKKKGKAQQQGQQPGASEEGSDEPEQPPGGGEGASKRAKAQAKQLRQQALASAAGGYGEGRVVEGSVGGQKAGEPLINFRVDESLQSARIEVVVPMDTPRVLFMELAELVAAETLVHHVPGIHAVHLLDPEKQGGPRRLQTEGINFAGLWEQQALLDVDKLSCNDVYAMLTTYGVEAARATILKEVQSVFGAYGIGVDPRHLGLIADFMTHTGGYRACNRLGIDSVTSPLLKMSFETAAKFLTDAALTGGCDSLASPAARLVVGAVTEVGTGCCKVLHVLE